MTTAWMGGSSASAIGGAKNRSGPTNPKGEQRWLKIGSVSTRLPPISTSVVE